MTEKAARVRANRLLRFCVDHGISLNREDIYSRLLAWDAQVARAKRFGTSPLTSMLPDSTKQQTSFEFGPRGTWPRKG